MPILLKLGYIDLMLELAGVSKFYGSVAALRAVDLVFPARRTSVLIGPSGCGKSTVLRILAGLVRPDTGVARIGGVAIGASTITGLRQRMGYVIQEGGLFPHLNAGDNITLMAEHLGWDIHRRRERLAELAELTALPVASLRNFPHQLSGGQRQRVALMRALMLDPELLLLDEPLGSLDPLIRYELQQDLADIFRRLAKTVVLVTHDMAEACYFGHNVVLMRDGRVVQQGTPQELITKPADTFAARFINVQRQTHDLQGWSSS